jgi:branched-chain amino acid transport system ATP-binding protein
MVYHYFPRLKEKRNETAGFISGGEQQMTVVGRALMTSPKMILLDEPSMGLAPLLIHEIFNIITGSTRKRKYRCSWWSKTPSWRSMSRLMPMCWKTAASSCTTRPKLRENPDIKDFYLGISDLGRKSFRDVKHYKRRKRWLT